MTRLLLACALGTGVGCGHAASPAPPAPAHPTAPATPVAPPPAAELTVAETGIAGLDGNTRVTLVDLRKLLAATGFAVKPDNLGQSLVYDVLRGDAQLFYVVPADDGKLFNLHVTSTKITAPHGWHVGGSLSDLSKMSCECWGSEGDEVATCFVPGEHVAVVYERACAGLALTEERNRKVLQGATISRLVWQPKPWAVQAAEPPKAPEE